MRLADSEELDDQRLARFEFDGDFTFLFDAVEKLRSGQDFDIPISRAGLVELEEDVRVHQVTRQVGARNLVSGFLFESGLCSREVDRGEVFARAAGTGL